MSARGAPEGLHRLNEELEAVGVLCELCGASGAVFAIVFAADPPTRSIKALFRPSGLLREASGRVARELELPAGWLANTVRARLSASGDAGSFELSHLRVFTPLPEYLLAMKCAALAVDRGSADLDDIRYLLRLLNQQETEGALEIVGRYFSDRQLPTDVSAVLDGLVIRA